MTMKVVVWNMHQDPANWEVLGQREDLMDTDLMLLCEAPASEDVPWIGHGSTKGLDCECDGPGCMKKKWSTVVAARKPPREIKDARISRYYRKILPFAPSRPGTWTAAVVDVDGVPVTAIALYGLMDERTDASVHRSLSELSPIFDHKVYGKRLLLGGDLNILANPRPNDAVRDRHLLVLERIKAYGLVDCLERTLRNRKPPRPGLKNCPCRAPNCMHTQTFRDRRKRYSEIPYQDDYLFASRALADKLDRCVALEFTAASDHAPIVATFDL